jgi:Peptidyl-prolyl cis-trans isomerase (rotamase) - cyclophilin family
MSAALPLPGKAIVVQVINGQPVTIEVDGTNAPITAGNFVDLVERGVYDGVMFHRVVRQPSFCGARRRSAQQGYDNSRKSIGNG